MESNNFEINTSIQTFRKEIWSFQLQNITRFNSAFSLFTIFFHNPEIKSKAHRKGSKENEALAKCEAINRQNSEVIK